MCYHVNMTKRSKLIQKILKGDSNISPEDAIKILIDLGYKATAPSGGSSHITFRKIDALPITLVLTQNPLKPYMVAKLQSALKQGGY